MIIARRLVYLRGRTLYSRIGTGQLLSGKSCPPDNNKDDCSGGKNGQKTREFALKNDIHGGVWYRLTFQITWKSDAMGQFKTWINGTKVHEELNIPTTLLDDNREFIFRVGLYANGWHDDNHEMLGSQEFRQVWLDDVGLGVSSRMPTLTDCEISVEARTLNLRTERLQT